jgi:hypothetical protein
MKRNRECNDAQLDAGPCQSILSPSACNTEAGDPVSEGVRPHTQATFIQKHKMYGLTHHKAQKIGSICKYTLKANAEMFHD